MTRKYSIYEIFRDIAACGIFGLFKVKVSVIFFRHGGFSATQGWTLLLDHSMLCFPCLRNHYRVHKSVRSTHLVAVIWSPGSEAALPRCLAHNLPVLPPLHRYRHLPLEMGMDTAGRALSSTAQ